jgi:regulator of sigma E protease
MLDFLLGNDLLSAIFAFGLVLIPAIIIHELGHFFAGKAVGITILEFGIGFPPRMLTLFTRGETEYTLNWLPIGGFVRPLGEDFVRPVSDAVTEKDRNTVTERLASQDAASLSDRDKLRLRGVNKMMTVNEAKPLARIFFLTAGSLMNLLTAVVLFTIIGLSGLPTVVGGSIGLVDLEADSALAAAGIQPGDVILRVNGDYFADSAGLFDTLAAQAGEPVTLTVQRGSETTDVTFTPDAAATATPTPFVYISGVAEESPAAQAGIQPGDTITAFNGQPFTTFDDLPALTQQNVGQDVTLTLLQQGETRDVTLVPRANPPEGQGAMGITIQPALFDAGHGIVFVDSGVQQDIVPLTLGESIRYGFDRIGFYITTLAQLPGQILNGAVSSDEARFLSPLAISQVGAVFIQQSIEQNQPVVILNFVAVISIALGITNLLPLPALDGGRILFVLIEIVRGRPIAPEREGMVHLIGMALLLSIFVVAFVNDILNPITTLLP